MSEIYARSWSQLHDMLFAESWDDEIGRFRSRLAFRGLSDENYELATTLMRLGGDYSLLERHLLRNFKKYAHRSMVERDSVWHWLALAQHHGLPTRLMDWTYSPYIALHFATANLERFDSNGVIWSVNYLLAHQKLPERFRLKLEEEGANVFTMEMLSQCVGCLNELPKIGEGDYLIFVEPPSIDDRIINQYSMFTVMPDSTMLVNDWLNRHPELWQKIIIPAELKWEIRDKLDQANITERVLFPGLDGLSHWLKRHYSPKSEYGR
ncbi:FRG domain-containing protein [uncultured Desulfuromonas sp.]|uniref:FRG domain-containing protein n=1 Tax=uncultured Desulfuromonas sp. TaxID=181013 RepID=UPI002AAAB873|nr:FRG domain-containing protein [uncultured Desulfuromonas sp.]